MHPISRPCFCGPRSPINGWDRSGPRRRPTIWATWTTNLSPPIRNHSSGWLGAAPRAVLFRGPAGPVHPRARPMIAAMRAAVLYEPGQPLRVEEVELGSPRAGEVRVRVAAAGVCHSDYHYMRGDLRGNLPVVLGHEGAGIVEEVGPDVTTVRPGDHVVLLWRTSCGRCEFCSTGRPALCPDGAAVRASGRMPDGTSRLSRDGVEIKHFLGVSCFAEQTVCQERSVLKLPEDVPLPVGAVAGCAVMTGVGAVVNTARVEPGSTVLVVGAGGVGLCAVMGAGLAGAARIVAADLNAGRLELATSFGATDVVDAS